jgi:hypothetical protein
LADDEYPRGLYLAYLMLEPIREPAQRRQFLEQFVDNYPGFAPAWEKIADLKNGAIGSMRLREV